MKSIVITFVFLTCSVAVVAAIAQSLTPTRVTHAVFSMPDGGEMTYGLSVPTDAGDSDPNTGKTDRRPLILALHPGGSRTTYYGSSFMQGVVEPAFRSWNAVIVAPDVPTRRWTSEIADRAVVALVEDVIARHSIDRARVLVTGFSLGGRGTWFFATRHADLFTGAIPMAGRAGEDPLEGLGTMPIHIIHSRDDEVVPYEPAAETAERLKERGHPVNFTQLDGVGHFSMGAYIEPLHQAGKWMAEQWNRK